jgi:hypothetical protein
MTQLVGLFFAVVGGVVALAPPAVALDRASWLIWIALAIALVYVVRCLSAPRQPLGREGMIVAFGISAFGPVLCGLIVLLLAMVGGIVGFFIEQVWGWFSQPPVLPRWLFDVLVALALSVASPLIVVTVNTEVEWLGRPPHERAEAIARWRRERGQAEWGRAAIAAALFLGAVALYAFGHSPGGPFLGVHFAVLDWDRFPFLRFVPFLLLQLALVLVFSSTWQAGRIASRRTRVESTVESVQSLLHSEGFEVERSPRDASDDAESLVRKIDLVARRGPEVFAVEVKTGADGRAVDWTAAYSLGLAASMLAAKKDWPTSSVRGLLVLVGAEADPTLDSARRPERVGVLRVSAAELKEAASGADSVRQVVGVRLKTAFARHGATTS